MSLSKDSFPDGAMLWLYHPDVSCGEVIEIKWQPIAKPAQLHKQLEDAWYLTREEAVEAKELYELVKGKENGTL